MCVFYNPYVVCGTINIFDQVDIPAGQKNDQIFEFPTNSGDFSFYDRNASTCPNYSTKTMAVECLDCVWYDGGTNKPIGSAQGNVCPSHELFSEVKIYQSLSKPVYKTWPNVRVEETDTYIVIYNKEDNKTEAIYTKNIDAGAFLAMKIK